MREKRCFYRYPINTRKWLMKNRVAEDLKYGTGDNIKLEEITERELTDIRADLETELYYLDREMRGMIYTDCMSNMDSRTPRDMEIDREYVLYNIDMVEREIRKRIIKTILIKCNLLYLNNL